MADELTFPRGGALKRLAPAGRWNAALPLVAMELRRFVRSWRLALAVVIAAIPSVQGLLRGPSYRLWDNFDLFDLMMSDWIPLLFVLLVTALYAPQFSEQLSHGFVRQARTRASMDSLVVSRIATGAIAAFTTFFLAIAIAWFMAFVANAAHGLIDVTPPLPGETDHPIQSRTAFSRLYVDPPILFGLVFAAWVGLNAALWAVIGGIAQIVIGNRFLALAAPALAYWGLDLVLALIGAEGFGPGASIFQHNVTQQAAWAPFVQFAVLSAAAGTAAWWISRRRYECAGVG